MEANGRNPVPDAEKLQIKSDSDSSNSTDDEGASNEIADSPPDDYDDEPGFENPEILRLVEEAKDAVRKLLENIADTLEQEKNGNAESFNTIRDVWGYEGEEDDLREFLKSFADLLNEEKKTGRNLSNLVEKLIATDPDANRHLSFFVGILEDMENEKGVTELSDALETYL